MKFNVSGLEGLVVSTLNTTSGRVKNLEKSWKKRIELKEDHAEK